MSDTKRSLFDPLLRASWKIIKYSYKWMSEPFFHIADAFEELPNAHLFFCGFCLVFVPVIVAYWLVLFLILLLELLILLSLGVIIGLMFVLVGVWPGPLLALGLAGISLVRLPYNITYHAVVTYRTVLLRTNLKMMSLILLPIIHLLVPVVTFLVSLVYFSGKYSFNSFIGFPLKNWSYIKKNLDIGWDKFATDMDSFYSNYGHSSGIPVDWDGRVYGLPVDPVVVIIAMLVYLGVLPPLSLAVFLLFLVKAVPIFLGTLSQFWSSLSLTSSLSWWWRVVTGAQAQPQASRSAHHSSPSSGHSGWIKGLKRSTKFIVKFIEGYAKIRVLEVYGEKLKGYASWVRRLKPSKLKKLISSYCTDLSPLKVFPSELGWNILCLWLPLLLTCLTWLLGLLLVITIPPATFLLALLIWLAGWTLTLSLWPILYLAGWIFIILGLPSLYLSLWAAIIVGPWLLSIVGALSGPVLALKIPAYIIVSNFYNPQELGSSLGRSVRLLPGILRTTDRWTASLSLASCRFSQAEPESEVKEREEKITNYWDLVVGRCQAARDDILSRGWLEEDDIASASPTSMIAVPGLATLSLLSDSLGSPGLVWSPSLSCSPANRDRTDNVANLFWPQLMEVRGLLSRLNPALTSSAIAFISASLCDGEDERAPSLAAVLESGDYQEHIATWMGIRAKVENIVHSLLRIKAFTQRLPDIIVVTGGKETSPANKQDEDIMEEEQLALVLEVIYH